MRVNPFYEKLLCDISEVLLSSTFELCVDSCIFLPALKLNKIALIV